MPTTPQDEWVDVKPTQNSEWVDVPTTVSGTSAVVRAAQGFNRSFGLSDDWLNQLKNARPLVTSLLSKLDPTGGAIKSVVNLVLASRAASQQGINRMKQPGIVSKAAGALETVEGGIPWVGPALVSAGRTGESGNLAGMSGELAGLITQLFGPLKAESIATGINRVPEIASRIPEAIESRRATSAVEGAQRAGGARVSAEAGNLASATQRGYMNEAATIYQDLEKQPQKGPVKLANHMENAAEATRQVSQRIQRMRDEIVDRQAENPVASVSGDDIGQAILDTITSNDVKLFPERIGPIVKEANRYFGKRFSSRQALNLSEDLNSQGRALWEAKPENTAAIVRTKAAKRSIDAAAAKVRDLIGERLTAAGEDGNTFRQFGRDYGTVRDIHEAFRDAVQHARSVEAGKPSYSPAALVGRSISRHPLLAGGLFLGGEYMGEPAVVAALPVIEGVRTFMERRGLPEAQINKAMQLFSKTSGPGPGVPTPPSPFTPRGLLPQTGSMPQLQPWERGPEGTGGPWRSERPAALITPPPEPGPSLAQVRMLQDFVSPYLRVLRDPIATGAEKAAALGKLNSIMERSPAIKTALQAVLNQRR